MFFTTQPLKQWGAAWQFRRRVKMAFDEQGIEIHLSHRRLYMGTGC